MSATGLDNCGHIEGPQLSRVIAFFTILLSFPVRNITYPRVAHLLGFDRSQTQQLAPDKIEDQVAGMLAIQTMTVTG